MTWRRPLAGGITHGLARALSRARHRLAGHELEVSAVPVTSAAADENGPGGAERARLRRKAGLQGRVALQISELMQGNVARCEDLRQRLATLQVPSGPPDPAAAAALEREIQALDRIVAWQTRTVNWHLGEARRLRDQAGRVNGPEDPAAGPAPGQTVNTETAPQPGGRRPTRGA